MAGRPRPGSGPPTQVVGSAGPVSRRRFLELVGALGAATVAGPLALDGRERRAAADAHLPPGYLPSYPEGVMAGDPQPDGAVIWTRLARPSADAEIPVVWEVAATPDFAQVAAGGLVTAGGARNWTVHVPVTDLDADRWYHYRFLTGGVPSPVGRLRTAPVAGSAPDRLRFAYASCQQRGTTYAAHRAISEEPDLDLFMHLGDYVYVSDGGTLTVDDYRGVYAAFMANPELQLVQRTVPLVAMFDDGEFYNGVDSTGDPARLAAAHQAWFETMPVMGPAADPTRAFRRFAWGNLAEIFMLDVRSHRDPAVDATDTRTPEGGAMLEAGRTTLGAAQRAWLLDGLATTTARWKLLGNPYNMGMNRVEDLDPGPPRPVGTRPGEGVYFPNEAWDDYSAERRLVLEHIRDRGITNVISCSGHTHVWITCEMSADPDDPDDPVVAFDFTTSSLTADPDVLRSQPDPLAALAQFSQLRQLGPQINPWMRFLDFVQFGYTVVTVEPCATTVDYKVIDVYDVNAVPRAMARFRVHHEARSLETQFFATPCWSVPDPEVNVVPAFGPGTGLTEPATCEPIPVAAPPTTTTTTTTTPASTSSTTTATASPATTSSSASTAADDGASGSAATSPPATPRRTTPRYAG